MPYRYNSTIKIKLKKCNICWHMKPIFSDGACQPCATQRDTLAAIAAESEKEMAAEGLMDIVKRLDDIFSKWIRLSHADKEGKCTCYTCGKRFYWTAMQAGHFIRRGNMLLRVDERNVKPQCHECNCIREEREMLEVFGQRLEKETPGIVAILREEQYIVYKPSRTDLNQMIVDYTIKFKKLKAA